MMWFKNFTSSVSVWTKFIKFVVIKMSKDCDDAFQV